MTQKVLKVGTSLGVTIPKHAAEKLGIRAGDQVRVDFNLGKSQLTIRPRLEKAQATTRRTKIAKLTADFIERYRSDLEALAHK